MSGLTLAAGRRPPVLRNYSSTTRLDAAFLIQGKFAAEKEVLRFDETPRSSDQRNEAGQVG